MNKEVVIEIKDLSKSFNNKIVLDGLNLDIYRNETITIMGRSGTGKSVLLKLLIGLLKPDKGSIKIFGKEIVGLKEEQLIETRKRVGMLFQNAALFDSLTVYENIAYPLREHTKFTEKEIKNRVRELLEVVDLEGTESLMPSELSGGMRKRIALARTLALGPEIILYDEPTTGLDPITANKINQLIIKMQNLFKVTSIVVTHDLQSAFKVTNRIAFLYKGKIVYLGNKEEVYKAEHPFVKNFLEGNPEYDD